MYPHQSVKEALSEPVSILMPVCNEVEGIESVLAEMVEVVFRHLPAGSEFLIEEGGSTDGTKELLRELNQRWPFLDICYSDKKEGFAKAARKLYERSKCPLSFFLDSDGQCVGSEFWKMAAEIHKADCVLGVKRVHHDPLLRRVASMCFNGIARQMFGLPFHDINFGFRLGRRDAILLCLSECKHMRTLLNAEMTIRLSQRGFRLVEVVVHHRPRLFGTSRGLDPDSLFREAWQAYRGLWATKRELEQTLQEHGANR